jgi:hypothetical protein
MDKISLTMTHCRRLSELDITLNSFLATNEYPIDEFIIIDDSNDSNISDVLIRKYSKIAKIIVNDKKIGQRGSLDNIFNQCRNEFIFHLEDDWEFDSKNNYVENSIKILKNMLDIHQVWVRHEFDNPHKSIGDYKKIDNVLFKDLDSEFNGWNGFSWNPGLRRKSDYLNIFPNGFIVFKDEYECAQHSKKFKYKSVILENTSCKHIGYSNSMRKENI